MRVLIIIARWLAEMLLFKQWTASFYVLQADKLRAMLVEHQKG